MRNSTTGTRSPGDSVRRESAIWVSASLRWNKTGPEGSDQRTTWARSTQQSSLMFANQLFAYATSRARISGLLSLG